MIFKSNIRSYAARVVSIVPMLSSRSTSIFHTFVDLYSRSCGGRRVTPSLRFSLAPFAHSARFTPRTGAVARRAAW